MSKLTSRTQLMAHNRRLKQEKNIMFQKYRKEQEKLMYEYNLMLYIQTTWIWKFYCFLKKLKKK